MDNWKSDILSIKGLKPKHILFLCVANSARSQMGEGIARAIAPDGITISSAGSEPKSVHPLAIEALKEIGIDISSHRAKRVSDINVESVDLVITLCEEEVCPIFPGNAIRLHWPLPDPAKVSCNADIQLSHFRKVRDEILTRIQFLFSNIVS